MNQQPATSSQQPATSNRQPATGNQQSATGNRQPATDNQQLVEGKDQPKTVEPKATKANEHTIKVKVKIMPVDISPQRAARATGHRSQATALVSHAQRQHVPTVGTDGWYQVGTASACGRTPRQYLTVQHCNFLEA